MMLVSHRNGSQRLWCSLNGIIKTSFLGTGGKEMLRKTVGIWHTIKYTETEKRNPRKQEWGLTVHNANIILPYYSTSPCPGID